MIMFTLPPFVRFHSLCVYNHMADVYMDFTLSSQVSNLSATSAHNEIVQEMNARIINNLTCVEERHPQLIEDGIKEVISMICQVHIHICIQASEFMSFIGSIHFTIPNQEIQ